MPNRKSRRVRHSRGGPSAPPPKHNHPEQKTAPRKRTPRKHRMQKHETLACVYPNMQQADRFIDAYSRSRRYSCAKTRPIWRPRTRIRNERTAEISESLLDEEESKPGRHGKKTEEPHERAEDIRHDAKLQGGAERRCRNPDISRRVGHHDGLAVLVEDRLVRFVQFLHGAGHLGEGLGAGHSPSVLADD